MSWPDEARLERLMARAPAPARALAVVTPRQVAYRRIVGVADLTSGEEVTDEHWWDLASLTKVLVTLPAVLRLARDQKLELESPLASQWARSADTAFGTVSAAQLLSHSGGFAPEADLWRTPRAARAEHVDALMRVQPERPAGDPARYSDVGFLALGEMVTDLGEVPIDELARLTGPFRFGSPPGPAVAYERCPWRGFLVKGVVHDENAFALGGLAGHAGAFARFDDLVAVAQSLLVAARRGNMNPSIAPRARGIGDESFGWGWWLGRTRGLGGTSPGPNSFGLSGFVGNRLWVEPVRGYAVALVSNRIHPVRGDVRPFMDWWTEVVDSIGMSLPKDGLDDLEL